jgi:hypothetical protein
MRRGNIVRRITHKKRKIKKAIADTVIFTKNHEDLIIRSLMPCMCNCKDIKRIQRMLAAYWRNYYE